MTNSPAATINAYVDACRTGDTERLQTLFHPDALMTGFYQGDFNIGSPRPFYEEVRDNLAPADSDAAYSGEIVSADIFGDIASVVMQETGYLGLNCTNLFHVANVDGVWKITCKSYIDR